MRYYNIYKIECDENFKGMKWPTNKNHELDLLDGYEIIFDIPNNEWKYQSKDPKQWMEYLVKINIIRLQQDEKVSEEGKIVKKNNQELYNENILSEDNFRSSIYKLKVDEINNNVQNKILNDFYSSVTGVRIRYQTSLTDQFEISQIRLANIDFKLKVYDSDGSSKRLFHTANQISNLYNEFFTFITTVKLQGDTKKEYLKNNYKTLNISILQNYNTDIIIV